MPKFKRVFENKVIFVEGARIFFLRINFVGSQWKTRCSLANCECVGSNEASSVTQQVIIIYLSKKRKNLKCSKKQTFLVYLFAPSLAQKKNYYQQLNFRSQLTVKCIFYILYSIFKLHVSIFENISSREWDKR